MNGKRAKGLRELAREIAPQARVTPDLAYKRLKKKLRKAHLALQSKAKPLNDRASRKPPARPAAGRGQVTSQTSFVHPLKQVKAILRREDYDGPQLAGWQLKAWGHAPKVMQDGLARMLSSAF